MKRLALTALAAGFCGFSWAQTTPPRVDALIEGLRKMGADVQLVQPFAAGEARSMCGYAATAPPMIHASAWGWKVAGAAEIKGTVLRDLVAISPENEVHCYDSIELGDLKFEDGVLVGAKVTVEDRIPKMDIASTSKLTFDYGWRRMTTHIAFEMDARELATRKSLTFSTSLRFSGIDFIALQENKTSQQINPLAFLSASLQSFSFSFYDRGLRDVILESVARETGSTARRVQREAYSSLEQARQFLEATGNQVLGEAISVIQDAIVDGGGGEILIEPARPVTVLDVVSAMESQSLDDILAAINLTSRRIP